MKLAPKTRIKVEAGGPIVNAAYIQRRTTTMAALFVDLKSKRCEIGATSYGMGECPEIWIEGGLYQDKGNEGQLTGVKFLDFKGWDIWCAECSRYTIYVCLFKPIKQ